MLGIKNNDASLKYWLKPLIHVVLYVTGTGASACTACPAGSFSGSGASACVQCPINTYALAASPSCTTCPQNQWSAPGSSACATCGAGSYTSTLALQYYSLGICNSDVNLGIGPTACSYATPQPVLGSVALNAQENGYAVPPGIQVWTVGTTGLYFLVAAGAAGASYSTYTPGYGMVVSNTYMFTEGQTVAISVGVTPTGCEQTAFASGGGGTFISIYAGTGAFSAASQHTPVLVAGGGGGVGSQAPAGGSSNGNNAVLGNSGTLCACCTGTAASNGGGGGGGGAAGGNGANGSNVNGVANAGGGGGFYFKGGDAYANTYGGSAFVSSTGPIGGPSQDPIPSASCGGSSYIMSAGGFGGGGGSWNAGGGGGGYSGGQGAPKSPTRCGGGGGGSYDATNSAGAYAATQYTSWSTVLLGAAPSTFSAGFNTGSGFVYIVPITDCIACAAGSFGSGAGECTMCLAGSYSNTSGQSACASCNAGAYASAAGDPRQRRDPMRRACFVAATLLIFSLSRPHTVYPRSFLLKAR